MKTWGWWTLHSARSWKFRSHDSNVNYYTFFKQSKYIPVYLSMFNPFSKDNYLLKTLKKEYFITESIADPQHNIVHIEKYQCWTLKTLWFLFILYEKLEETNRFYARSQNLCSWFSLENNNFLLWGKETIFPVPGRSEHSRGSLQASLNINLSRLYR